MKFFLKLRGRSLELLEFCVHFRVVRTRSDCDNLITGQAMCALICELVMPFSFLSPFSVREEFGLLAPYFFG